MIASVHLADHGIVRSLTHRVPKPSEVPGLRWSRKALCAPISEGALPRPQLGRSGVVAWWDDDASLDAFLASDAAAPLVEGWSVRLRPTRSRAAWPTVGTGFGPDVNESHDGVHAAVTLGTTILRTTPRFLRVSSKLEAQFLETPGGLWGIGITMLPKIVMTLTFWEDEAATDAYVRSGAHGRAMREHYDFSTDHHEFITEGGFFGFAPYAMTGALAGPNPTPERLLAACA